MQKECKISFCIVCMNRLHQLKETLLSNISDNEDYNNLQFVLLDYNSADGMGDWVQANMSDYITSGKLVYYRTNEPLVFNHSHSKNLAFKLADGDVVCNVNADHYCGKGFARYINEAFNREENIVLTTIDFHKTTLDYHPPKDVFGKVCVSKQDFLKVKGFDERMNRYGFEDWDFVNRLEMINVKRVLIDNLSYLKFISHGDEERYSVDRSHLQGVYTRYCTPAASEFIFLYKNSRFEKGMLIDNATAGSDNYQYAFQKRDYRYPYTVKEPGWETGNWEPAPGNNMLFVPDHGNRFTLCSALPENPYSLRDAQTGMDFYEVVESASIENILGFNYLFYNRSLMEKSIANKTPVVNLHGFGEAAVFKNFRFDKPIHI